MIKYASAHAVQGTQKDDTQDFYTDATLMSTTRLSPHPTPIRPYPLKKKFRTKGGGPPLRLPRVPQITTSASVIAKDHEYTKGSFISTRATKRQGKKFHWTPRSRSRSQSRTTFPIYSRMSSTAVIHYTGQTWISHESIRRHATTSTTRRGGGNNSYSGVFGTNAPRTIFFQLF